jgi:hypothetical protein
MFMMAPLCAPPPRRQRDCLERLLGTVGDALFAGALVIGTDPFLTSRSERLAALALHHAVPAISTIREFVAAGGLISYSGSNSDMLRIGRLYRQVGPHPSQLVRRARHRAAHRRHLGGEPGRAPDGDRGRPGWALRLPRWRPGAI